MKKLNELHKKVDDETIKNILSFSNLTCKMISTICGISMYQAKKVRLEILDYYGNEFPYSKSAQVRTEHFLKYYKSERFFKIYKDLYNVDLSKAGK